MKRSLCVLSLIGVAGSAGLTGIWASGADTPATTGERATVLQASQVEGNAGLAEAVAEPGEIASDVLPAEHERLLRAIRERRLLEFRYGGHRRLFEPHAYGLSPTGEAVLHGFQIAGESSSAAPPGWRTFTVGEMSELVVSTRRFPQARPGYGGERFALDPLWAEIAPPTRTPSSPRILTVDPREGESLLPGERLEPTERTPRTPRTVPNQE